nr:hypothetical protein GCM10020063_055500 [Dactylosporangium thailandense]
MYPAGRRFAIATSTAYLLAAHANDVTAAARRAARLARRPSAIALDPAPLCQRAVNGFHVRVRGIGGRSVATLKTCKILTKLRCCL